MKGLLLCLLILTVVGVVGAYSGYATSGVEVLDDWGDEYYNDGEAEAEEESSTWWRNFVPIPGFQLITKFWEFIGSILPESLQTFFQFTWDSVCFIFNLMTFRVDGVPSVLFLLVFVPMMYIVAYTGLRLVRGGG